MIFGIEKGYFLSLVKVYINEIGIVWIFSLFGSFDFILGATSYKTSNLTSNLPDEASTE
jgi:hypothetical protein